MLTIDKKAARIARAKSPVALDRLIRGLYVDCVDHSRGCSVGCDAIDIAGWLRTRDSPHKIVADHDGTPEWLEHLRDAVYEGLPAGKRAWWHVALAEAIPVDTDLTPHFHAIMARIVRMGLRSSSEWDAAYRQQVIDSIEGVVALHDACAAEDDPRWAAGAAGASRTASAAYSAWAAASATAWAARAAWAAAWAAWAAAWAARAARTAGSAAGPAKAAAHAASAAATASSADAAYLDIAEIILAVLTGKDQRPC